MGTKLPKQYLPLLGKPIIQHSIERLCSVAAIGRLVVVLASDDKEFDSIVAPWPERLSTVVGGAERSHSVQAGLRHIARSDPPDTWVLVHDAARPCVRSEDIRTLIDTACAHPVGGILAVPVRDTMKRSDESRQILETVERDDLWHALTPQMFRLGELLNAIDAALAAEILVTDEAQAMERMGKRPLLVTGHADNIKVTQAADRTLAELYLRNQFEEQARCA